MPDEPATEPIGTAEPAPQDQDTPPADLREEFFQRALESGDPPVAAVARARAWQSPFMTDDEHRRKIGDWYYPRLYYAFKKRNHDSKISVQDRVHMGIALKADGDMSVNVWSATIKFDWSEAMEMLFLLQRRSEDVVAWIPEEKERKRLSDDVFGIATFVATAVNVENTRHEIAGEERDPPTDIFRNGIAVIRGQMEQARVRFVEAAERHALNAYARGMLIGVAILGLVTGLLAVIFGLEGISARFGVAVPAGALGATVSVLRRMTTGKLRLNYQTDRSLLVAYGALRPAIGAIFGMIVFALIFAGLIPALAVPKDHKVLIAFYAVFAFIAGFNERFAQDMLAGAARAAGGDVPADGEPPPPAAHADGVPT